MKTGVLAEPVLVGRDKELKELESFLNSAVEGKGHTVLISGEAGSGKTRLTHEFLTTVRNKGAALLAGWCLSDAAVPYFPFVEAFDSYFASIDEEEPMSLQKPDAPLGLAGITQVAGKERGITAWLTGPKTAEKPGKPQPVSPQVWKDQVFAGVARTLHAISTQQPIILFLEDIHWADSASLALLHYIARAVNNSEKILVLATYRSEELTTDAEGHPHPLAETLRMMRREDLFTEIALPNLTSTDIIGIAENMIGGIVDLTFADKLSKESHGNALFAVESLRMLVERKSLFQENNQWRLAVDELSIPSKIKDIILRRLATLKYNQRRVLDAASVIGEKFDVELLGAVLKQDALEVLESLNLIAQSTSLVCVDGSSYRFDHAKSREILYEGIPLPLKRGYHGRIAERMEKTSTEGKLPTAELAYHYAQAGNDEKALKFAIEAGRDAYDRFSNAQAINQFSYVLKVVGEDPKYTKERITALEGLGDACAARNMFSEALKTFEKLSIIAVGVLKLRALRKAAQAAINQGNLELGTKLAAEAEEYMSLDRVEAARLYSLKAHLYGSRGQVVPAFGCNVKALQIFEEEYSLPDVAQELANVGFGYAAQGELEKGLANELLSVALLGEIGDLRQQMSTYFMVASTFGLCGLFPEELKICEKALEIEEKMKLGDLPNLAMIYWLLALRLEDRGNYEQALSKSLKALEYAEKTDSDSSRGNIYGRLVIEYVMTENMKSAEKYFEKLMKLPPQSLQSGFSMIPMVKAIYFAGQKNWQESKRYFKEYFDSFKHWQGPSGTGSPVAEAGAKLRYSWALSKEGLTEEAAATSQEAAKILSNAQKRFEHANTHTNLIASTRATVGQPFEVRLDLVNISRTSASLVNIQDILPQEFQITASQPEILREGSSVQLKESKLEPFTVKTIKLTCQPAKPGTFTLNPLAVYIDDLGQTKTRMLRSATITAKHAEPAFEILPGRLTTGYTDLDRLLLGGIPEKFAVVLTAPSSDERQILVKHFLEAGGRANETTLYITCEPASIQELTKQYQNLCLIDCSPQTNQPQQNPPNIIKLKGIDNLTNIEIALTKYFRTLDPKQTTPRRNCIDILSDVLLQHHAVITRKWLSALLPNLKQQGFAVLAVVNPDMHSQEEVQAILDLFDGEIQISEKETTIGIEKVLRVRRLLNQKYLKNELTLTG